MADKNEAAIDGHIPHFLYYRPDVLLPERPIARFGVVKRRNDRVDAPPTKLVRDGNPRRRTDQWTVDEDEKVV